MPASLVAISLEMDPTALVVVAAITLPSLGSALTTDAPERQRADPSIAAAITLLEDTILIELN